MKFPFFLLVLVTVAGSAVAGLQEMAANPAGLDVARMKEVPLAIGKGPKAWMEIPKQLTAKSANIFKPDKDMQGHTEFSVTHEGYVLLACNYSYQGNPSGDWQKDVMTERDFKRKGWRVLTKSALGGLLVQGDGRVQVIFWKKVKAGERYDLRCNKYDPPYPILLH
ncbi:MAG: hypothetical protein ACREKL_00390 [Chthoniobacterales bacterium]